MNVYVATHSVARTQAIKADLVTRQPQYAGQYPVTLRMQPTQLGGINFSGRTTPNEHGVGCLVGPDLGTNTVRTEWRAVAPRYLTHPIGRRRDGIATRQQALVVE